MKELEKKKGRNARTSSVSPLSAKLEIKADLTSPAQITADLTKPAQQLSRVLANAANFIGKVFGPSVSEMGGLITDQMKHWRASNLDRIYQKWQQVISKRNIPEEALKAIPVSMAIRIVEAASIEDDEEVQDLWAKLIASSMEDATRIRRLHIDILKQLTGVEAIILKALWLISLDKQSGTQNAAEFFHSYAAKIARSDRVLGIQNLIRMQCIRRIIRLNTFRIQNSADVDIEVTAVGGRLMQYNLIEKKAGANELAAVTKEELWRAISEVTECILTVNGARDEEIFKSPGKVRHFPEWNFELTELGKDIMKNIYNEQEENKVREGDYVDVLITAKIHGRKN